jgi:hypothetical protein
MDVLVMVVGMEKGGDYLSIVCLRVTGSFY